MIDRDQRVIATMHMMMVGLFQSPLRWMTLRSPLRWRQLSLPVCSVRHRRLTVEHAACRRRAGTSDDGAGRVPEATMLIPLVGGIPLPVPNSREGRRGNAVGRSRFRSPQSHNNHKVVGDVGLGRRC